MLGCREGGVPVQLCGRWGRGVVEVRLQARTNSPHIAQLQDWANKLQMDVSAFVGRAGGSSCNQHRPDGSCQHVGMESAHHQPVRHLTARGGANGHGAGSSCSYDAVHGWSCRDPLRCRQCWLHGPSGTIDRCHTTPRREEPEACTVRHVGTNTYASKRPG